MQSASARDKLERISQQLFRSGKLDTDTEDFHSLLQFGNRGISRCDTDVGILRILAVGVGCAGSGQHNASLLAQGDNPLGTALHHVYADKVTAVRLSPGGYALSGKLCAQMAQHRFKFRCKKRTVKLHMLQYAVDVLEEHHVTQLVELIRTDGLEGKMLPEHNQVAGACTHCRNARAWERESSRWKQK